jgi:Sugar-binding cellulase-like
MRPTFSRPYAITMWDFSWLERRWPGAGYENWDSALEQLAYRGYDAVRIDAFPHLVATDPEREWELLPVWNQQTWGASSIVRVRVLPELTEFIRAASRVGIKISLSSWFREDRENARIGFATPESFGRMWVETLRHIEDAGLLDQILFVDLCNEFPLPVWAPWLYVEQLAGNAFRGGLAMAEVMPTEVSRTETRVAEWMAASVTVVGQAFPELDVTYSFATELTTWRNQDVSALDVLEPHIWMANNDYSDYYDRVGYHFERFDSRGYDNVVAHGRQEYQSRQDFYDQALFRMIDTVVEWSRTTGKPLYITECWSLVDYKDWPGLEWDWILDINARAVEYAASTGRFVGMATSNFCGPQFNGMWREVEWHRRLTTLIKSATIDEDIRASRGR